MQKYLLNIIILIAGCCNVCYAQQSAVTFAEARAWIIAPISINKTTDMDFGNVAVSTQSGGTVVLNPAGGRVSTGGVSLPTTSGSPQPASFSVTGESNYSYTITLPTSATLGDGLGNTMIINSFTSTPQSIGTLNAGTQNLSVGATLSVNAGQQAGNYSTQTGGSSFNVTVNYN
ncbi:hypothetical protein CAP35_08790 [Chitinophagaceae bacterium IBVUCB1]|nr:hypothetical protein CAP35_08790 [Chitinophagaceae bacterium IBVUCB1]